MNSTMPLIRQTPASDLQIFYYCYVRLCLLWMSAVSPEGLVGVLQGSTQRLKIFYYFYIRFCPLWMRSVSQEGLVGVLQGSTQRLKIFYYFYIRLCPLWMRAASQTWSQRAWWGSCKRPPSRWRSLPTTSTHPHLYNMLVHLEYHFFLSVKAPLSLRQ